MLPRLLNYLGRRYVRVDGYVSERGLWSDYKILRGPQTNLVGWAGPGAYNQYVHGINVPAGKFVVVKERAGQPIVWLQGRDVHTGHGGGWAIFDTEQDARDYIHTERDDYDED